VKLNKIVEGIDAVPAKVETFNPGNLQRQNGALKWQKKLRWTLKTRNNHS
jgi:hypothetical protein